MQAPAPLSELAEDLEPGAAWRAAGMRVLEDAEAVLWSAEGERARAYLHGRGLNDETLRAWRLGVQPEEGRRDPAERWGFPACDANGRPAFVRIPRGIVLPWLLDGQLWQLTIRANREQPKYLAISGGHPCLFGADTWFQVSRPSWPRASSTPCCCGRRRATWSAWPRSAVAARG